MADYYAKTRSNYFKVKSPKAFGHFCTIFGLEQIQKEYSGGNNPKDTLYGFLGDDAIPNGFCTADGDFVETDFIQRLAAQLQKGEVAIVMEVGSEKHRYLVGWAIAVNSEGKNESIYLEQIYRNLDKLTDHPERVRPCEY